MRAGTVILHILAASILLTLASGCQQEPGPISPVSGRVTYKGAPLQGGYIVFVPDLSRGAHGPIAWSKINPDGTYSLKTGDAQGAPAGDYRVTVSAISPTSQAGAPANLPRWIIPEKYSDPDLSEISCQVKPRERNVFDFPLN